MDNRVQRAAADRRNWHLMWGTIAGCALVVMRLFGVAVALTADEGGAVLALINLTEALVCALLVWATHRRHLAGAIALLVLWALEFAYGWIVAGSIIPPFALISLAIGVGLFLGTMAIIDMRAAACAESDALSAGR